MSARSDYKLLNRWPWSEATPLMMMDEMGRALDEIDELRATAAGLRVELDTLRARHTRLDEILSELVAGDDECSYDHHGYCQQHNWFGEYCECGIREARELLAAGSFPHTEEPAGGTE